MNTNAASDPNPATRRPAPTPRRTSPWRTTRTRSTSSRPADFPAPDFVDQAIEVATTLYIESNGVFNTNPYAAASTINGTSFAGIKVNENGETATTTGNLLGNKYPTATDPLQHLQHRHDPCLGRWLLELDL